MTCSCCAKAEARVLCGEYDMNCRACRVRYTALQPKARREFTYSLIEDEGEREAFIRDVADYWKRRQASRQAQQ